MNLSKKKQIALSKAIHDTILNKRLNIMKPNNNLVYTPAAVDEMLYKLELQLRIAVFDALEVENV